MHCARALLVADTQWREDDAQQLRRIEAPKASWKASSCPCAVGQLGHPET